MAKAKSKKTTKKEVKKGPKKDNKKVQKKDIKKIEPKTKTRTRSKGQEVMQRIETGKAKESKKMLIILGGVVAVLALFYLIAGVATGSIDLNKNEPAAIQYSEILAGSTFKQTESEYIIIYFNYKSEKANDYMQLISNYTQKEKAKKLFAVDLSRKFNESYIKQEGEESNTNPTSASELKVQDPTLIHIKDKKVITYVESYEEIESYLS